MRLADLLADYALLTHATDATMRLHKLAVLQFSRTLLRHAELTDLTEANLARHLARRKQQGKAAATLAGEASKLLALWRFACRQGLLTQWPTAKPPKIPQRVPRAWTQQELELLFQSVEFAVPMGTLAGRLWWRALFLVLWDSGERISAVLALEWSNIDLIGGTIYVPAETRKGGQVDRLYRIAPDTIEALDLLPRERRPFWFGCSLATIYLRLARMLKAVGLPSDRRSKFHRIRRSTASHYEAAGGNATELLGHSSRVVTRGYLDPRIVRPQSAVDLLFRPTLKPPPPPDV